MRDAVYAVRASASQRAGPKVRHVLPRKVLVPVMDHLYCGRASRYGFQFKASEITFAEINVGETDLERAALLAGRLGGSSSKRQECQLPPFRHGRPFFCRESTRQMERIRSGLRIQGTSVMRVCIFPKSIRFLNMRGIAGHYLLWIRSLLWICSPEQNIRCGLSQRLSVPPLRMPLTVPASGSCGLSLPDLALLAAWGRKGMGGALTGCRQELLRLHLERPEKSREEEMEGHPANSCLLLRARESLPLQVEDSQATRVTEKEGRREGERSI